jgi:hypothetical protein
MYSYLKILSFALFFRAFSDRHYLNAKDERRFRVSVGGSPIHIFGLNEKERKIEMLDTPADPIPMYVQNAVAEKLLTKLAA